MTISNQSVPDEVRLDWFELPRALARPAVMACRAVNTVVDHVFYDVPGLLADLARLDREVATTGEKLPSRIIDLGALTNPEGVLLLIDTTTAPYVHRYESVSAFLDSPHPETRAVDVVTITGVGSSALGSAAMGWAVSKALAAPVLAIVPGYGIADVMLQGLGGWFGFGLADSLHAQSAMQDGLANLAPGLASLGRALPGSIPGSPKVHGAPVYRHGSGSSDVLHALLRDRASRFRLLVGHSKGALQIGNAIRALEPEKTAGLTVVTLGCPIAEDVDGVTWRQYLGLYDALGQLNMWGHQPDRWVPAWHSTNPAFPLAMDAGTLAAAG